MDRLGRCDAVRRATKRGGKEGEKGRNRDGGREEGGEGKRKTAVGQDGGEPREGRPPSAFAKTHRYFLP